MATKQCEACDAKIGENEKVCPACSADLESLEQTVSEVDRANKILAKRKAKETPPTPENQPETKKQGFFSALASKRKAK